VSLRDAKSKSLFAVTTLLPERIDRLVTFADGEALPRRPAS
jgi:hypothetical protein